MTKHKLNAGQTLWWVPANTKYQVEKAVTVLKVGRKGAELNNGKRIDLETLRADGGVNNSPGRCYLSRTEYEDKQALIRAWDAFRSALMHRPPADVTLADIEAAQKALHLTPY